MDGEERKMTMTKLGSFLKVKVAYVRSFSHNGWRYYNFATEYFLNILFPKLDIIWFILYLENIFT